MGIFDIFKKPKKDKGFPVNDLEKSLIEAYNDVSARNRFYTKLLWNDLIVLTDANPNLHEGVNTLNENTTVQFVTFEDGRIPIFTSENRIFDKGVVKEKLQIMSMKGQDLFGIAKGATFVLNPYSDYGKELLKEEIESLIDGSIFEDSNSHSVEKDTEVLIGQPTIKPTEFLKALSRLFQEHETVKSAFVGIIKMAKSEEEPHLIIAIDLEADLGSVTCKAIPIAEKMMAKEEVVDFIKIDDKGGVSDYFTKETKPFYTRD